MHFTSRDQSQRIAESTEARSMSQSYAWLFVLLVAGLLAWWTPIAHTFSLALNDDEYTHLLIIIPVSLLFIFLERRKLRPSVSVVSYAVAIATLAAALAIFFIAAKTSLVPSDDVLTLSMAGFILWCLASFISSFGLATFRLFLFPLCFLFWLVPWPQSLLDFLIRLLQQYSASSVEWMFHITGIPVIRTGVILSIPSLTIEVARECSSIRSSIILLVTSMILAQLFLSAPWRKVVVVVAAIPLSVAKNAVRIYTLSMLGIHVNRGFLTGRLHHEGGAVFYAGALAVLFVLILWFQRQESARSAKSTLSA